MIFAPFPTCEECTLRMQGGGEFRMPFVGTEKPAEPTVERFEGLLRTARVLIEKRVDEASAILTLTVEGRIARDGGGGWADAKTRLLGAWEDDEAWRRERNTFLAKYSRAYPVEVVDGALILQWTRANAWLVCEEGNPAPREVLLEIAPEVRPNVPRAAASRYERTLNDRGVPCREERRGSIGFEKADELHLRVRVQPVDRPPLLGGTSFPSPRRVEEFCEELQTGRVGKRGPRMKTTNLVLACTAFFLRTYGGLDPKEIHKLLNAHVLSDSEKKLPEGYSAGPSNQLWQNVRKVHGQLVRAMHSL
jgi:hypothetical protein